VQDGDIRRMVPNTAEQAVMGRMKAMRAKGIGAEVGMQARSVQRILDRASPFEVAA